MLLVCLAAPAIVNVVGFHGAAHGTYHAGRDVVSLVVGTALQVLLVIASIAWLRWWPVVWRERQRAPAWVWAVPALLVVVSIGFVDYGQLQRAGWGMAFGLLVGTLLIGAGEELLFRGVTLTFARSRYREEIAAAVATMLFAAFHLTSGPVYAAAALFGGFLFYAVRRASGGILVPIVVHGIYDFSVLSPFLGADAPDWSNASPVLLLLSVLLSIALLIAYRRWLPLRV